MISDCKFFIVNVLLQQWVYIFELAQHEGYPVPTTGQVLLLVNEPPC